MKSKKVFDKIIGERLKELRLDAGFSMEKEADSLNKEFGLKITKSMMSRWESSTAEPSNTFLSAYALYHNIDLNYLVGLINVKRPLKIYNSSELQKFMQITDLVEQDIIKKYRALDERGRFRVKETVDSEYSFISKQEELKEAK